MAKPEEMYQCQTVTCGYINNPDKGDRKGKIPKGAQFADLPDDWKCPVCGAGKKLFKPLQDPVPWWPVVKSIINSKESYFL